MPMNVQPEASSTSRNELISPRTLQVGAVLRHDLYDTTGLLLTAAGTQLTPELIDKLRRFHRLYPHKPAAASTSRTSGNNQSANRLSLTEPVEPVSRFELDRRVEETRYDPPAEHDRPVLPRMKLSSLRAAAKEGEGWFRSASDSYAEITQDMLRGRRVDPRATISILDRFRTMIQTDPSLGLLITDLKSEPDEYLFTHGLNVSLLTMSVAIVAGFDEQSVLDAGLGAMLADLGMHRVPNDIRFAERPLTASERSAVEYHPIHTVHALESLGRLNDVSLLVAYQMHERTDGTGYPKRRSGQNTHPLARIAGVADTYAAMTCARPHRPYRHLPYDSVVTVLRDRKRHCRFAVRAFVECVSLFPIGSLVRLSDNTPARVLRSSGVAHTRPVIVPMNANGSECDQEVDLSRYSDLYVANVLRGEESEPPTQAIHRRASDFQAAG